jgi:hypothetical protein
VSEALASIEAAYPEVDEIRRYEWPLDYDWLSQSGKDLRSTPPRNE